MVRPASEPRQTAPPTLVPVCVQAPSFLLRSIEEMDPHWSNLGVGPYKNVAATIVKSRLAQLKRLR